MLLYNQVRTAFRGRKMTPDETLEFLMGRVKTREDDIAATRNGDDVELFRKDVAQCASEAARILGYMRESLVHEAGSKNGKGGGLEQNAKALAKEEGLLLTKARLQWEVLGSHIMQCQCALGAGEAYKAAGMEKEMAAELDAAANIERSMRHEELNIGTNH